MKYLWLLMTLMVASMSVACGTPEQKIAESQSAISERVASFAAYLDAKGLSLLKPYSAETPNYFGNDEGWTAISMPSKALLMGMSYQYLQACSTNADCASHEFCDAGLCAPTHCAPEIGVDCSPGEYCFDGICYPGMNPSDPGCPTSYGYTGFWCGGSTDAASFAECCGWCGCDLSGCQYDCSDSDDCPGTHAMFPYQHEP